MGVEVVHHIQRRLLGEAVERDGGGVGEFALVGALGVGEVLDEAGVLGKDDHVEDLEHPRARALAPGCVGEEFAHLGREVRRGGGLVPRDIAQRERPLVGAGFRFEQGARVFSGGIAAGGAGDLTEHIQKHCAEGGRGVQRAAFPERKVQTGGGVASAGEEGEDRGDGCVGL